MIKIPVVVSKFERIKGVSNKTGKPYDFYDCWLKVDGYDIPWREAIFANSISDVELRVGMQGFAYIDQDRNMKPKFTYRFG